MLKNYIAIAIRTLRKNKSYVIINTLGLGIALACCITSYLLVAFNVEFDDFHADEKVKNVYKIHAHMREKDGRITKNVMSPYPLAPAAASEISGIDSYCRYIYGSGYARYGENAFGESIAFVDSTFFSMFDFPVKAGNHRSFNDKYTLALTEERAIKYFGDEDAVGKTLILSFPNEKEINAVVGAVIKKMPQNTSFDFGLVMRIENFFDINNLDINNWSDWRDPSTFVVLSPNADPSGVSSQLAKYVPVRNEVKKDAVVDQYKLEPFKSSFTQDDINASYVRHRISFVPLLLFVSMATLILLIACFNLTNTSIALTAKRLKEVGVRKAVGAVRSQIISQFLFETAISIVLALAVGLLLAQFIVPAFAEMWRLTYGMNDLNGVNLFVTLIFLVFIASLLAGVYPALFNSGFKPVSLLKGTVKLNGTNALTRSLVAAQFGLSVIVLVAGVMFLRNTKYQESIKFGYDKEKVLLMDVQNENEFTAMRDVMVRHPKVEKIAVSDHQVGYSNYDSPVGVDTAEYRSRHMGVGKDYFETMGFRFTQGRPFDMESETDIKESVIVNEAFLKHAGIVDDPLDKIIVIHGVRRHIVGVIDNFLDNLYRAKEPEPFVFYPSLPEAYKLMLVRAEQSDLADLQKYMENQWKQLFPAKPFLSRFQEDVVMEGLRETNGNLETIFLFLTVLGGALSASGIFSLASLNIAKRTKEIGIRKALGASVANVMLLLNREFIIILSIASILGGVAGFWLTKLLMDEIYAFHVEIGIVPIVCCGLVIFLVGILTTCSTIYRAALANPVKSLRAE